METINSTTTITTTVLWPFVQDYPGEPVHLLGFMVHRKITEADTDNMAGHNPTSNIPTIFMPDPLSVTTLVIYPGLGRAQSMLGCITDGLVNKFNK